MASLGMMGILLFAMWMGHCSEPASISAMASLVMNGVAKSDKSRTRIISSSMMKMTSSGGNDGNTTPWLSCLQCGWVSVESQGDLILLCLCLYPYFLY